MREVQSGVISGGEAMRTACAACAMPYLEHTGVVDAQAYEGEILL